MKIVAKPVGQLQPLPPSGYNDGLVLWRGNNAEEISGLSV